MATLAAHAGRSIPHGEEDQHGLALTHHRLMLVLLLFAGVTALVVLRLIFLQAFTDRTGSAELGNPLIPPRADIVDRNGIPLARTIDAWSIGVHPRRVIGDRDELARRLHDLIPERSVAEYRRMLGAESNYLYLARRAVPELVAAVNALGEPAVVFNREPERLYPQAAMAGHVLGWTDFDGRGVAGMERVLEERLTDPGLRGSPVALAIDSRVQATMESELASAVAVQNAEGGTGIVLDVRTGEVIAMASAPTFDPNAAGRSDPSALYNRATMGVYELGSVFKPITVAAAMEAGVIDSMARKWDASAPLAIGRFRISDYRGQNRALTVPEILVHSSNIATARVADAMGPERMQAAFRALGFHEPAHIELHERGGTLWPRDWGRATVLTSGFGHGIAVTPLHLASAYAALVNGGVWRPATLMRIKPGQTPRGRRVFSEATSRRMRQLLRLVATHGSGRNANVPGFRVGGKTGTAEKVSSSGGYSRRVNVSTFAAAFPMDDPHYVVLVMMDAPKGTAQTHGFTTAGWTAAPVVGSVIARVGPLLGIIPDENRDVDNSELLPLLANAGR
ncbi:penicillin-binding protein 2 [Sphingosinicella sp. CPCC 101087]|uniref:peptidoglycan D,D-transpeptidase FtsI family protein n=1 Tax=Sphingosinicella sp. CPCC 101087 TaxID=2497754 RepID=UPI00101B9CC3|nr:penicillin-binding protein 2 [Sphingosinicella sp. CPCC 101087]